MNDLVSILQKNRMSLPELLEEYEGVVIVGSHAASCARPNSDWDLVLIGSEIEGIKKKSGLDLMFENPTKDPNWLNRELASHMTQYAVWLKGERTWNPEELNYDKMVEHKERVIVNGLSTIETLYRDSNLLEKWLYKYVTWARILCCLQTRTFVPPRALLPYVFDRTPFKAFEKELDAMGSKIWNRK